MQKLQKSKQYKNANIVESAKMRRMQIMQKNAEMQTIQRTSENAKNSKIAKSADLTILEGTAKKF